MDYKRIVRSIIDNKNFTLDQQINAIKQSVSTGQFKDALKMHPKLDRHLRRDPFFKSLDSIYQKEPFLFSEDFKREYKWVLNLLEPHFATINKFLERKNEFEKLFVSGSFQEARLLLGTIENDFGITLWSIESYIMLDEYTQGTEANWSKLSYYLGEIKNPFYEFIINYSSKRFDSKLSHEAYVSQFQNDMDTIQLQGMVRDFFVFKCFAIALYDYDYKDLSSVLLMSNLFSIIDQYLILIDAIVYNTSLTNDLDSLFIPFVSHAKTDLKNDSKLINVYNAINNRQDTIEFEQNNDLTSCMDLYYKGLFKETAIVAAKKIIDNPLEYGYYELYCKSLLNQKNSFTEVGNSPIINQILSETYNLLSFEKGREDGFKNLFKYSLALMNMNLGRQIYGLMSEIESNTNKNYFTGILSATANTPKNLSLCEIRPHLKYYINNITTQYSMQIQAFKLGYIEKAPQPFSTSIQQNIIYQAIHDWNLKKYSKVINDLENAHTLNDNFYYYERKMSLLYNCYIKEILLKKALATFASVFFDNRVVSRKIDHNELYEAIKREHFEQKIADQIEFCILCSLLAKEYDLFEVYDEFMISQNLQSVREIDIDDFASSFTFEMAIYFLHNVTTIETLKYSTEYGSVSEVEEDRIYILQQLLKLDPLKKLIYEKEINDIYRINSVRKVLKEVDEGRLYIDISSLKQIQIKKFKDEFNRFKEIEFSSSTQPLIGFNAAMTKNWETSNTETSEPHERYNSADYLAFKSIYLESRDNFLFSKEYGLDSCLSTRIRHGALKNHIRSVFEKLNLVTSKFNDVYKENELWTNQLAYYPELSIRVQEILRNFSMNIDVYTSFIVDNLIQIQTEKMPTKENGLFSYHTNDEILFSFYNQHKPLLKSVDATIDIILSSLTNYTLINIQTDIVEYFEGITLKKYQDIIETTLNDLRNLSLPTGCELIPHLIKSSTDVQIELENIAN